MLKTMPKVNERDARKFLNFLNHNTYWVHVFRPDRYGERQSGDMLSEFTTSHERVLQIANEYNGKGLVCVAINEREKGCTKTEAIKKVSTMMVDIDVRKEHKIGFVSPKHLKDKAIDVAMKVKDRLWSCWGLKTSLIVDSGNGAQVYLRINAEADTSFKRQIIRNKLEFIEQDLKNIFSDDEVCIDHITKDLNRRVKLPGTINCKDTAQSEDRVSKIIWRAGHGK